MTLEITAKERPFEAGFIDRLQACADHVFQSPSAEREEIAWRLENMPDAVVHCAHLGSELIGFKIAYATRRRRLYSWLGGVQSQHRRRGVARALMEAQHQWAKARGYVNVETGTIRNNLPMMTLNLQSGFQIIGTYARAGTTRVLMAKRL